MFQTSFSVFEFCILYFELFLLLLLLERKTQVWNLKAKYQRWSLNYQIWNVAAIHGHHTVRISTWVCCLTKYARKYCPEVMSLYQWLSAWSSSAVSSESHMLERYLNLISHFNFENFGEVSGSKTKYSREYNLFVPNMVVCIPCQKYHFKLNYFVITHKLCG